MSFIPLEFYAYAAATLGVGATLLLAKKRKSGWILSIISTLIFVSYGIQTEIGSFVVVEMVSIGTSVYALDRWAQSSDRHEKKSKRRNRH